MQWYRVGFLSVFLLLVGVSLPIASFGLTDRPLLESCCQKDVEGPRDVRPTLGFASCQERDTSVVSIRFRPNVGDQFRMRVTQQYNLEMNNGTSNPSFSTGTTVTQFLDYSVDSLLSSNDYTISQHLDRVLEEKKVFGQSQTYDSDHAGSDDGPVTKSEIRWEVALNHPLQTHVTRAGEVKKVPFWNRLVDQIIENALDRMTSQMPESMSTSETDTLAKKMDEIFRPMLVSDDFVRGILHQRLPDSASVAIGDSWTQHFQTSVMKPLPVKARYELREIDGDKAIIDVRFNINYSDSTDADPAIMSTPSMTMRIRAAEGRLEGLREVHIPTGITTRMDVSGTLDVRLYIKDPINEQTVTMKGDRSFSLRFLEGLDGEIHAPGGAILPAGPSSSKSDG